MTDPVGPTWEEITGTSGDTSGTPGTIEAVSPGSPVPTSIDQPTAHPTFKVLTGGAVGALATAIVQAAGDYGVVIKPASQSLLVLLLSFAAAYITRERT